ncbi:unnamed protein product [Vitrella brassicaformis CCMP3155]|uniref:TLDc domain-containing protein n=1 Tax=Vitrella brassicaformis (strain CCMP3155) TaxID=1169540 RepID=A0A0G4EUT5_VITBC|nr:unnamed protein product [Vitrella brassicaformis CCMP3155]|eukprot:CEM02013.1 unnamed protein product [Vitrella brassicaformis CCMP3155]
MTRHCRCAALLMVTVSLVVSAAALCVYFFHLRRVEVSLPEGTSLSVAEYEGLLDLMGNDRTELTSVYRSSVHGTIYDDLLDSVGDAEPLVFVIRKDKYVFGAFSNCGLELPDDPTGVHHYDCDFDLWWFSLAGHFEQPTKIDIPRLVQHVIVAGREGSWYGANMYIGGYLVLGDDENSDNLWLGVSGRPAADIRSCYQYTYSRDVPAGYMGVRDSDDDALLGGSKYFHADEIEVLHVMGNSR